MWDSKCSIVVTSEINIVYHSPNAVVMYHVLIDMGLRNDAKVIFHEVMAVFHYVIGVFHFEL